MWRSAARMWLACFEHAAVCSILYAISYTHEAILNTAYMGLLLMEGTVDNDLQLCDNASDKIRRED